jgi:hypothetical protein
LSSSTETIAIVESSAASVTERVQDQRQPDSSPQPSSAENNAVVQSSAVSGVERVQRLPDSSPQPSSAASNAVVQSSSASGVEIILEESRPDSSPQSSSAASNPVVESSAASGVDTVQEQSQSNSISRSSSAESNAVVQSSASSGFERLRDQKQPDSSPQSTSAEINAVVQSSAASAVERLQEQRQPDSLSQSSSAESTAVVQSSAVSGVERLQEQSRPDSLSRSSSTESRTAVESSAVNEVQGQPDSHYLSDEAGPAADSSNNPPSTSSHLDEQLSENEEDREDETLSKEEDQEVKMISSSEVSRSSAKNNVFSIETNFAISTTRSSSLEEGTSTTSSDERSLDGDNRERSEIHLPDQDEESSMSEPDMLSDLHGSLLDVNREDSIGQLSDFDDGEQHSMIPTFVGEFIPNSGNNDVDSVSSTNLRPVNNEGVSASDSLNEAEPVEDNEKEETMAREAANDVESSTQTKSDVVGSSNSIESIPISSGQFADFTENEELLGTEQQNVTGMDSQEIPASTVEETRLRIGSSADETNVRLTEYSIGIDSPLDGMMASSEDQTRTEAGYADTTCIISEEPATTTTIPSNISTVSSDSLAPISDVKSESADTQPPDAEASELDTDVPTEGIMGEVQSPEGISTTNTDLDWRYPDTIPISPASPESTDENSEVDNISPVPVWQPLSQGLFTPQTSSFTYTSSIQSSTTSSHFSQLSYPRLQTQRNTAFPFSSLNVGSASSSARSSPVSFINIGRSQSPCPPVLPRQQEPIPILSDKYEPLSDDDDIGDDSNFDDDTL